MSSLVDLLQMALEGRAEARRALALTRYEEDRAKAVFLVNTEESCNARSFTLARTRARYEEAIRRESTESGEKMTESQVKARLQLCDDVQNAEQTLLFAQIDHLRVKLGLDPEDDSEGMMMTLEEYRRAVIAAQYAVDFTEAEVECLRAQVQLALIRQA